MQTVSRNKRHIAALSLLLFCSSAHSALNTNETIQTGKVNINHSFQCGGDNDNVTYQTGRININHTVQRCRGGGRHPTNNALGHSNKAAPNRGPKHPHPRPS